MRIAWIGQLRDDTLHKTSNIKMTEELNKRGNDVRLFMVKSLFDSQQQCSYADYFTVPNIPVLSGICYGLLVFFYFPFLLQKKFDLIIVAYPKVLMTFVIPLKLLNIPMIVDIRTLPVDKEHSIMFKYSMKIINKVADGFSTITSELLDVLRNRYNLSIDAVDIWSSGVAIDDFCIKNNKRRESSSDDKGDLKLIYHGSYSKTRGIENLIISISRLPIDFQRRVRLLIVGIPNSKIQELKELTKKYGIDEYVEIRPKVDYEKIIQLIKESDAGIIPLPPDNIWWKVSSPLKTLEYMAAEKPVIATNIPFHQQLFSEADIGVLLESADHNTLAKGIKTLFEKKEYLQKLGKNGRRLVEKKYTFERLAESYEEFLKTFVQ